MSASFSHGPWALGYPEPESVVTAVGSFYWLTWGHLPHQHEQYGINPKADARLIACRSRVEGIQFQIRRLTHG